MAIIDVAGLFRVPAVDDASNEQTRDILGNKADTAIAVPDDVSSAIRYLKGILAIVGGFTGGTQGLYYYGVVTAAPGIDEFTIPTLAGLGVGKFDGAAAPYRAFVFRSHLGVGGAPQGECWPITAYNTATGVFKAPGFSVSVDTGDEMLIIHPRLAEVEDLVVMTGNVLTGIGAIFGSTGDASVSTLGSLYAILGNPAVDIGTMIVNLILDQNVPVPDVPDNTLMRDVIGNKADAPVIVPNDVSSEVSYLKGILNTLQSVVSPQVMVGSTTADWETAEADVVSIGGNDIKTQIGSCLINISQLTVGAAVMLRMYSQINGVETQFYESTFIVGTDLPGIPIFSGPIQVHEVVRITAESDTAGDNGRAIDWDYMIEPFVLSTASPAIVVGSTPSADWTGETDVVFIGADNVKNRIGSLLLGVAALTVGAMVTIRMYTQINGVERQFYEYPFVIAGIKGIPVFDGLIEVHEAVRVTAQSTVVDMGAAIDYDYMITAL